MLHILRSFDLLIQVVFKTIPVYYADLGVFFTEIAVWPYCYIVIVRVASVVMVFSAQEPISSICCAWLVFQ